METAIAQPLVTESINGEVLDYTHINQFKTTVEELALVMSRTPVNGGLQLAHNAYTLAHHAIWVQRYVLVNTGNPYSALQALFYRAHEVFTGSYPSPVKHLSYLREQFEFLDSQMQRMVYDRVQVLRPNDQVRQLLDRATLVAQALEARNFSPSRSHEHIIKEIPADAHLIYWDHCSTHQVFRDFLTNYQILVDAVAALEGGA